MSEFGEVPLMMHLKNYFLKEDIRCLHLNRYKNNLNCGNIKPTDKMQ